MHFVAGHRDASIVNLVLADRQTLSAARHFGFSKQLGFPCHEFRSHLR